MELVENLNTIDDYCKETLNLVHLISIDMGKSDKDEKQLDNEKIESFIQGNRHSLVKYKFDRLLNNKAKLDDIQILDTSKSLIELISSQFVENGNISALKATLQAHFINYNLYLEYKIFTENYDFIRLIGLINNIYGSSEIKNVTSATIPIENKLNWLGTPAQFGFIINELVEKGFIECPATHGSPSISRLSKVCLEIFDLSSTPKNIEKELNPEKNTLSDYKKGFFKIPNINELK